MSLDLSREELALEASLQDLAHILFAGRSSETTLQEVAQLAQRTIPGCDAASVTIMDGGKLTTVSTAGMAVDIDRHQYSADEGPCLEAMRTQRVVRVDTYEDETRWREFVAAIERWRVGSSLSLPLVAVDQPLGALNLYSLRPAAFTESVPTGEAFAAQAAITLANAAAYHKATELARNLAIALERRDVIGQAKGILMARDGVSSEEAFEVLRRASQRSNRKVHELAQEIVNRNPGRS